MTTANSNTKDAKKQEEKISSAATRQVEVKRADPYVSTYVNSAQVQMNFFDFRINFGEIVEISEEKLSIVNKVTIIMTPEHAKLLSNILALNVKRYEEEMGTIRDIKAEGV